MNPIIERLLASPEPAIRYKTRVNILGENPRGANARKLRAEIASSPRVRLLLSERNKNGEIPYHPYQKWYGAHWVLTMLAELDYPPGDTQLIPLRERVLTWLLSPNYARWIPTIKGRARIHASIEGNAIWYLNKLGLADERVSRLVARLLETQWPDGGWNCDKTARGNTSSFHETIIPMRALIADSKRTKDKHERAATKRAAEVFLTRCLFKRRRDSQIISPRFIQLHYPAYWHYDFLFGLKVMGEGGWLRDPRCADALDLLESKRLPEGGFPAEAKYYRASRQGIPYGRSLVEWGPTGKTRLNEFVTVDALTVLKQAGRFNPKRG
ncbi:MAG TPA: hypothetical protein VFD70_21575 [Anaerolineae bacterium]|nr:hypothetical protein [Anaerolineae bacterium]